MQRSAGELEAQFGLGVNAGPMGGGAASTRASSLTSGRSVIELAALGVVYLVTVGSLVGFATFTLHPELLIQAQVSAATYGRILSIAPRAQILVAVLALALVLVRRVGARWVPAFIAVYVISLGAELAGTTVGLPFGPYRYTDGLGFKLFAHVPALIPASWFMMALPSYAVALRRFPTAGGTLGRIALGSFILLSWDFALDPAMSFVTKYWVWGTTGPYYGMPILNLFGWFVTGVALMVACVALRVDRWLGAVPTPWLLGFYGANLLLPVGMNVAAGLWGAVVATGVALGVAAVLARSAAGGEARV
jgi:putative membrane protein